MATSTGLVVQDGQAAVTTVVQSGGRERTVRTGKSVSESALVRRIGELYQPSKDFFPIPNGVRFFNWVGSESAVLAVELDPEVRTFPRWIEDAPRSIVGKVVHAGESAKYKSRTLAHPYIVFVLPFQKKILQTGACQAFYRTEPLTGWDDKLLMTNLLNVAEGYGFTSWVCMVGYSQEAGLSWQEAVEEAIRYLYWSAFNRSSEIHEKNSHYGTIVQRKVDERVSSVERWERETREHGNDPGFMLEVPWPETGHTLRSAMELSARALNTPTPSLVNLVLEL